MLQLLLQNPACCCCCCCCRTHQECAAKARKVLQDALTKSILAARRAAMTSRNLTDLNAATAAAKAAAATAASAAIAAGGDGRQLDTAAAAVLGPILDSQLLPAEQRRLLLPLLRLRQACCHPQVTSCAGITQG
jgi:hypothetical protein